jgi:hypothetical protein
MDDGMEMKGVRMRSNPSQKYRLIGSGLETTEGMVTDSAE